MATVQRQLNLYGFKCYSSGENKGSFAHPQFLQGQKDAAGLIQRYYAPKKQPETSKKTSNNKKRSMRVMLEDDSVDAEEEEEEEVKTSRFTKHRRGVVAMNSIDDESVGSFGTNCDSSLTTSCCDQKSSCMSSSSSSYPMYQCDWHSCHNNNNNNNVNNNNFQHLFDTFVEKQSMMNLSLSHPDNYSSSNSQLYLDNAVVPSFDVSLFPLEEPVSPITPNIDAFAEYYYHMVTTENVPQTNHIQDNYTHYSQDKMFASNNSVTAMSSSYHMLPTQDTTTNHQYNNTNTLYTSSEPTTCEIGINTDLSQGWGYDPMDNYFPFGYGI